MNFPGFVAKLTLSCSEISYSRELDYPFNNGSSLGLHAHDIIPQQPRIPTFEPRGGGGGGPQDPLPRLGPPTTTVIYADRLPSPREPPPPGWAGRTGGGLSPGSPGGGSGGGPETETEVSERDRRECENRYVNNCQKVRCKEAYEKADFWDRVCLSSTARSRRFGRYRIWNRTDEQKFQRCTLRNPYAGEYAACTGSCVADAVRTCG